MLYSCVIINLKNHVSPTNKTKDKTVQEKKQIQCKIKTFGYFKLILTSKQEDIKNTVFWLYNSKEMRETRAGW